MPTQGWLISWKRNRNHRGREVALSEKEAVKIFEKKRRLKFKVQFKRLHRRDPLLIYYLRCGSLPPIR